MIGREGAARLGELGHREHGGPIHRLGVQVLPYFVEVEKPIEKLGILHGRQVSREGLVEMVVGVDEPREDDMARRVDDIGSSGGLEVFPDPRYAIFVDENVDAR